MAKRNSATAKMMTNTDQARRPGLRVLAFGLALLALFLVSFFLGRFPIRPAELLGLIYNKTIGLIPGLAIEPFWSESAETIFMNVRLPRVLLACLVGCCISTAGAAYQGVFQNPMAAPDLLGASSGAAFGAALGILLGGHSWTITLYAFVFSLITVGLVMLVGEFASGSQVIGLILGGIIISSLFSSGTSYLKLVADPNDQLPKITYWLMGSLTEAKMKQVGFAIVPMLIGIIILAQKTGSDTLTLNMNREQLAQFLCVNRSSLSNELSLMQQEGLIEFRKNKFRLLHS